MKEEKGKADLDSAFGVFRKDREEIGNEEKFGGDVFEIRERTLTVIKIKAFKFIVIFLIKYNNQFVRLLNWNEELDLSVFIMSGNLFLSKFGLN